MRKSVVVIGSGIAGTLAANDLSRDHDVTVLEIGKEHSVRYPNVSFRRKVFGDVKTFCHAGGGTTNLWHNGLMPIQETDLHDPQFARIVSEVNTYSNRAAEALFYPNSQFLTDHKAMVLKMQSIGQGLSVFSDGLDCLLYPQSHSRLRIADRANAYYSVTELRFFAIGGKISRLEFTSASRTHSIIPTFVIVAAGSLGSPGVVRSILDALGKPSDAPGKGLMDHPMGFVGKIRVSPHVRSIFRQFSSSTHLGYRCCTAARVRYDGYSAAVYFRPAITMQNRLDIYKYKSRLGAGKGLERLRAAFSRKVFHPDVVAEIYSHLFNAHIRSDIFSVLVFFEQKRGQSQVRCSPDGIDVDWDLSPNEMDVYSSIIRILRDRLGPVCDDIAMVDRLTKEWLWSAAHHSGTISLDASGQGLVDGDLRLASCSNAFVCDGSVIQEHSYTNTGLTIGGLAFRLASTIRGS